MTIGHINPTEKVRIQKVHPAWTAGQKIALGWAWPSGGPLEVTFGPKFKFDVEINIPSNLYFINFSGLL